VNNGLGHRFTEVASSLGAISELIPLTDGW
jgi:hypothetical protein